MDRSFMNMDCPPPPSVPRLTPHSMANTSLAMDVHQSPDSSLVNTFHPYRPSGEGHPSLSSSQFAAFDSIYKAYQNAYGPSPVPAGMFGHQPYRFDNPSVMAADQQLMLQASLMQYPHLGGVGMFPNPAIYAGLPASSVRYPGDYYSQNLSSLSLSSKYPPDIGAAQGWLGLERSSVLAGLGGERIDAKEPVDRRKEVDPVKRPEKDALDHHKHRHEREEMRKEHRDDMRRDEIRRDDIRRDEARRDEMRREDVRRDEMRRDQRDDMRTQREELVRRDDARMMREESRRDPNRDPSRDAIKKEQQLQQQQQQQQQKRTNVVKSPARIESHHPEAAFGRYTNEFAYAASRMYGGGANYGMGTTSEPLNLQKLSSSSPGAVGHQRSNERPPRRDMNIDPSQEQTLVKDKHQMRHWKPDELKDKMTPLTLTIPKSSTSSGGSVRPFEQKFHRPFEQPQNAAAAAALSGMSRQPLPNLSKESMSNNKKTNVANMRQEFHAKDPTDGKSVNVGDNHMYHQQSKSHDRKSHSGSRKRSGGNPNLRSGEELPLNLAVVKGGGHHVHARDVEARLGSDRSSMPGSAGPVGQDHDSGVGLNFIHEAEWFTSRTVVSRLDMESARKAKARLSSSYNSEDDDEDEDERERTVAKLLLITSGPSRKGTISSRKREFLASFGLATQNECREFEFEKRRKRRRRLRDRSLSPVELEDSHIDDLPDHCGHNCSPMDDCSHNEMDKESLLRLLGLMSVQQPRTEPNTSQTPSQTQVRPSNSNKGIPSSSKHHRKFEVTKEHPDKKEPINHRQLAVDQPPGCIVTASPSTSHDNNRHVDSRTRFPHDGRGDVPQQKHQHGLLPGRLLVAEHCHNSALDISTDGFGEAPSSLSDTSLLKMHGCVSSTPSSAIPRESRNGQLLQNGESENGRGSSEAAFHWPGIETIIESYHHYVEEQAMEKQLLVERSQRYHLANTNLMRTYDQLQIRKAELVRSKQQMIDDRAKLQAAIDGLKSCVKLFPK